MSDISSHLGYDEPQASPRPMLSHGPAMAHPGEPVTPALLPDEPMGQQPEEQRSDHFGMGASEARPGGDMPALGEAAEGGEAGEGLTAAAALL